MGDADGANGRVRGAVVAIPPRVMGDLHVRNEGFEALVEIPPGVMSDYMQAIYAARGMTLRSLQE